MEDLVEQLEDELYALRDMLGDDKFPRNATQYLNEWAAPEKGWLRKFYRDDSDEVGAVYRGKNDGGIT